MGAARIFFLFLALGAIALTPMLEARPDVPTAPHDEMAAARVARVLQRSAPGRSSAIGSGRSMEPLYGDGTVLLFQRVPFSELEAGMVVAFKDRFGQTVTHELVTRSGYGWVTKGRGNRHADRGRVTAENLVGVVYLVLYTGETAGD